MIQSSIFKAWIAVLFSMHE